MSQPLDVILDVMARQVAHPDDHEERDDQQAPGSIEPGAVGRIKAVHGTPPRKSNVPAPVWLLPF